jgi:hypothetical protein
MIDTAKPYFLITPLVFATLQDSSALGRLGLTLYGGNKFYLKHPFRPASKNIAVRFNLEKRVMWLETSLAKFVQGHNVFGSNRAEYLCFKVLEEIYRQLGLVFTDAELKLVRDKRIRLGRLDLTASFRLHSQQEVIDVLALIFEHLKTEGCTWGAYGIGNVETVYNQPNSTRLTDKFYNKYLEILKHKIPFNLHERDLIIRFVERLIRFELTLRGKELNVRRGLSCYADEWTPSVVQQVIMKRIKKLNFQGAIKQSLQVQKIVGLNKGEQMFYDLWASGCDFSSSQISYAPLNRARNAILPHGVDLFKPRSSSTNIALNQILSAGNAYFYAPKALTRTGAIFG